MSEVHLEPKNERKKEMRINVPKNRLANFHNVHSIKANAFVVTYQSLDKPLLGGGLSRAGGQSWSINKDLQGPLYTAHESHPA